ncbi:protein disulfide isomerase EPS1 ASCRUDRAFT_71261 [Ascoidea rubescens DSM 1968]|uniref:Thioredoxin domain-containing protein n=1 Tax=Ascoidea rubescens DSM 1968 TaxID=1344418 RepID=A0A1D2VDG5_9ASCO|nr:hypothetical protein ASCRUDRAFT_71261 [Ascoidea rubescens DSM 1968]ODV59748.1 hypothetical protein ASCRUDRAFT_71261 [Ascoidea rubescens DSM 1968]
MDLSRVCRLDLVVLCLVYLLLYPFAVYTDAAPPSHDKKLELDILPPSLTMKNFNSEMAQGIHFVEFYSPYCGHCQHLAPIWEETYQQFLEQSKTLNVQMNQVNCAENGDLCEQESIKFYPNLRVYVSNKDKNGGDLLLSYPKSLSRNPEDFINFMRDLAFEYGNLDELHFPSRSQLLPSGKFLQFLNGDHPQNSSVLVSFWPSTDDKFSDLNNSNEDSFDLKSCPSCLEFQSTWNLISNQLSTETYHFNCHSNQQICKKLGYDKLATINSGFKNVAPKVMMILPKQNGNRIKFTGLKTKSRIVNFTKRLLQNMKFEKVNPRILSKKMNLVSTLENKPIDDYNLLPFERNSNKISFVFYYNPETVTPEDFEILDFLLEPIMSLPDVYIFTSDDGSFIKLQERQGNNLLKYINYNKSEPIESFNNERFISETTTSYPTFLCFKDNSLISSTFQNFHPRDIRDYDLVLGWMRRNSLPILNEISSKNWKQIVRNNKNKDVDKIILSFIDSTNKESTINNIYNLSLGYHDFEYHRKSELYKELIENREKKNQEIEEMKTNSKKTSSDVIHKSSEMVEHSNRGQGIFGFIDINKKENLKLIEDLGFDNNKKMEDYKENDVIIIEKNGNYYYDKDYLNDELKNEPWRIRNTMLFLTFPRLNKDISKISKNLIDSPFNRYFRFMDFVHQYGVIGYLVLILAVYFVINGIKKYNKYLRLKRIHQKNPGLGIIGNINVSGNDGSKFE